MRKIFYALLMAWLPVAVFAAPGDTTWVQAQNNIQITAYGAFDAPVTFPTGTATYRKVYMEFTLGTYNCPTGSQYCHQWDYDVHNILMPPSGDTVELSRFITPYATSGAPPYPSGWTYRYIFDVSDYYPLLKGSNVFRIFYSGYSYGFTANVRFAFIEGTPERDVISVKKLWNGYYNYGKASDPIDNYIVPRSLTAPSGTAGAEIKALVTGHGADATGCCEFAAHGFDVKLNSNTLGNQVIWRADCGYNEQYPQGGSWVFNRANWCPGSIVDPYSYKLPGITGGNNFTTDFQFDSYTNTNTNYGGYNVHALVVYYGAFNKTKDASLENIISPSDFEGYVRENPTNAQPVITVRNSGRDTITTMQIAYRVKDSATQNYTWNGKLLPTEQTRITLPELQAIKNMSLSKFSGKAGFEARIASVNGSADADTRNDTLRSRFTVAPNWPNTFVINMKTNNQGTGGIGAGQSETSWEIMDAQGNVVASRTGADISTTYVDTVALPKTGMYTLKVTDLGCDGLNWWYATQYLGATSGSITVRELSLGMVLPCSGNNFGSGYSNDFGCGFSQNFSVFGYPAEVPKVTANSASMTVYPNPANDHIKVELYGLKQISGTITIVDVTGRTVLQQTTTAASTSLSLNGLANGFYNCIYTDQSGAKAVANVTVSR